MRVGYAYANIFEKDDLNLSQMPIRIGLYYDFGNQNILVKICSCSSTRNYFLPISWKSLKSLFHLKPLILLIRLQTSSTVSYSVMLIVRTYSSSKVFTLIQILFAQSFSFFSFQLISLSQKSYLPRTISAAQRIVKAYFFYYRERYERFKRLIVTVWLKLTRFQ